MLNFLVRFRVQLSCLALGVALTLGSQGLWSHYRPQPHIDTVAIAAHNTSQIADTSALTPKIVEKLVTDPKDRTIITALLKENATLKTTVTQLTVTNASLVSQGSGTITTTTTPSDLPVVAECPKSPDPVTAVHFTDYRLKFDADLTKNTAAYALNQKFEVVSTTGRNAQGAPVSLVNVFELGAKQERIPLTDVTTTSVFADATSNHVQLGFSVLGGIGKAFPVTPGSSVDGAVLGIEWLSRGKTHAAADTSYAFLSPVVFVSQGIKEVGILPVSVNLGKIPHQPFQNLWASPLLTTDSLASKKITRIGFTFHAIF